MNRDAGTSPFTQIGTIARSHGLKGELKVTLETESPEVAQSLNMVYLRNERGDFYPCRIASLRTEGKGNRISFFVQFDHIADRNSAEALKGRALFIDTNKADAFFPEDEEEESFLDFEVTDENDNHVGLVTDEMDNGAQLVLVIATTKGSLLVPVVDQFVTEINEEEQVIRCCNLDLLEADDDED